MKRPQVKDTEGPVDERAGPSSGIAHATAAGGS